MATKEYATIDTSQGTFGVKTPTLDPDVTSILHFTNELEALEHQQALNHAYHAGLKDGMDACTHICESVVGERVEKVRELWIYG